MDPRRAAGGHAPPRFCPPRGASGDQPNPGSGGLNIHPRSASPPQPPKPEADTLADRAALEMTKYAHHWEPGNGQPQWRPPAAVPAAHLLGRAAFPPARRAASSPRRARPGLFIDRGARAEGERGGLRRCQGTAWPPECRTGGGLFLRMGTHPVLLLSRPPPPNQDGPGETSPWVPNHACFGPFHPGMMGWGGSRGAGGR